MAVVAAAVVATPPSFSYDHYSGVVGSRMPFFVNVFLCPRVCVSFTAKTSKNGNRWRFPLVYEWRPNVTINQSFVQQVPSRVNNENSYKFLDPLEK